MDTKLKIGLFSLKDGMGCTSMAIHVANYLAGSEAYSVALVEKLSMQRESEYKNIDMRRETDGTFMKNNVCYYPADINLEIEESVAVYDIGSVNAAYKFDEAYDKLYLCTDNNIDRIGDILQFRAETGIDFDCLLFGASKDQLPVYAQNNLKGILVADKKEERIDYNFYLILSQFMRIHGMIPPEYHKDWEYASVSFTGYIDPSEQDKGKKKNKSKPASAPVRRNNIDISDLNSDLDTVERKEKLMSNIFEGFDMDDIPAPEDADIVEPVYESSDIKEEKPLSRKEQKRLEAEEKKRRIAEEKQKRRELREAQKTKKDSEKFEANILREREQNGFDAYEEQQRRAKMDAFFNAGINTTLNETENELATDISAIINDESARKNEEEKLRLETEKNKLKAEKEQLELDKAQNEKTRAILEAKLNADNEQAEIYRKQLEEEKAKTEKIQLELASKSGIDKKADELRLQLEMEKSKAEDLRRELEAEKSKADKRIEEVTSKNDINIVKAESEIRNLKAKIEELNAKESTNNVIMAAQKEAEEIKLRAREEALIEKERILKEQTEYLSNLENNIVNTVPRTNEDLIPTRTERKRPIVPFKPATIDPNDNAALNKALEIINRDHKSLCNIFLVTKADSLFVFSSVSTFVSKLSVLKREIRNTNNISYIVLTYNDNEKKPVICFNGKSKEDVYSLLYELDNDLRINPYFTDDDLRAHRELTLFNEVLYTS